MGTVFATSAYALGGANDASRPPGPYPGLAFSTYLGGTGWDHAGAIAVDARGSAYITGSTRSADFPATWDAFATSGDGDVDQGDVFVAKLTPDGSRLEYATYVGGTGDDTGVGIAVDAQGSAYVTGQTGSVDFPVTAGAFDTTYNSGEGDAFVVKLNPAGSALEYSTYVGGTDWEGNEGAEAIAVDAHGSAYITGSTHGDNFPTTPGAFDRTLSPRDGEDTDPDAFVAKLNRDGSGLAYSTYLGGEEYDAGVDIAVDAGGRAHVTGSTGSVAFPITAAAFDTALERDSLGHGLDGFVTKLNAMGSGLAYSTYVGGAKAEFPTGVALDARGSAYVTGRTGSSDFPTTAGALRTTYDPACDSRVPEQSFVTKLTATGRDLAYSTYLSEPTCSYGMGIAVDASGSAYLGGPVAVSGLNPAGSELTFTYLLQSSAWKHIALDGDGNAYVGGTSGEISGRIQPPATEGALDTTHNGLSDAFVAKLVVPRAPKCHPKKPCRTKPAR